MKTDSTEPAARKERLKQLILKLHHGVSEEEVRNELIAGLKEVPYKEVVEVEQELISGGVPVEEILQMCDLHSRVLDGSIDLTNVKEVPAGHPVDVFKKENREIRRVVMELRKGIAEIVDNPELDYPSSLLKLRALFNQITDVDKHYLRKEYLLFPFLEKVGITGPPKVMWGKHDEIRELLKGARELLASPELDRESFADSADLLLLPAVEMTYDMIGKEESILLPMSLEKLTEEQWYQIDQQSPEFGFCLYDPPVAWRPEGVAPQSIDAQQKHGGEIRLPTGSFSAEVLLAMMNTLPIDVTFVDRNDQVKYFSQSAERIFPRNRAVLNRDVRLCHPPGSAHIVEKIIEDFRSGREDSSAFWINLRGKMIFIEYYALRNEAGEYLGTLEMSHNIDRYRALEGEQRILSYGEKKSDKGETKHG